MLSQIHENDPLSNVAPNVPVITHSIERIDPVQTRSRCFQDRLVFSHGFLWVEHPEFYPFL